MNILVIGLGSMGKRRVRLIREMYPEYTIFGVNGRETRRKEAEELFQIICFAHLADVDVPVDCAFVCTPPLTHASVIELCLNRGWHVFTELNLVDDGYENNMRLAAENGCKLFLSSTFLYREEIGYLGQSISTEKKWNYVYHIGQYLPDWHPWENYRDFFAGNSRSNGCREIMAIELPWLTRLFGEVTDAEAVSDKMTSLQIDYHDNYMIRLAHANGSKGILVVDIVSPCAVRRFEAYTEGRYLRWDGTPDSLFAYDAEQAVLQSVQLSEEAEHMDGYRAFVVENAYKNEIRAFFDVVLNGKTPIYGFGEDRKTLELITHLGA